MNLLRFEPWSLVDRVHREGRPGWVPAVDILEENERFVVRVDVPGVNPGDIEVQMENNTLSISGERVSEDRSNVNGVSRYERASGRFLRRFALPESVDADAIKATSTNGILEISIPKQVAVQARRITVEAA